MTFVCFPGAGSDGSLCVTELQAVLQTVPSTDKSSVSSVTCRRIQRLQPLHTGTVKDRVLKFCHLKALCCGGGGGGVGVKGTHNYSDIFCWEKKPTRQNKNKQKKLLYQISQFHCMIITASLPVTIYT